LTRGDDRGDCEPERLANMAQRGVNIIRLVLVFASKSQVVIVRWFRYRQERQLDNLPRTSADGHGPEPPAVSWTFNTGPSQLVLVGRISAIKRQFS
jgi:hypothetical protein